MKTNVGIKRDRWLCQLTRGKPCIYFNSAVAE